MKRLLLILSLVCIGSASAQLSSGRALELLRKTDEKQMTCFDRCVPLVARSFDEQDETTQEKAVYIAKASAVGAVLYALFGTAYNQWPAHNSPEFFSTVLRPAPWMSGFAGDSPRRWGMVWGATAGGFAGGLIGALAAVCNKLGKNPSLESEQLTTPVLLTILATWMLGSMVIRGREPLRFLRTTSAMNRVYTGGALAVLGLLGYIIYKRGKQATLLGAQKEFACELLDDIIETQENEEALAVVRKALA